MPYFLFIFPKNIGKFIPIDHLTLEMGLELRNNRRYWDFYLFVLRCAVVALMFWPVGKVSAAEVESEVRTLIEEAKKYSADDEYELAVQKLKQADALLAGQKPTAVHMEVLIAKGNAEINGPNPRKCLEYFEHSLKLAERELPNEHRLTAITYARLGVYYYYFARNHRQAQASLESSIRHWKLDNYSDKLSYASALLLLSAIHRDTGGYAMTSSLLDEVYEIRRNLLGENHEETVRVLLNRGNLAFESKNDTAARRWYEKALAASLRIPGDHGRLINQCRLNLAVALVELGEYEVALGMYAASEAYYSKPSTYNPEEILLSKLNIGLAYARSNQFTKAYAQFNDAKQFCQRKDLSPNLLSYVERDLVFYFTTTGDLDSALTHSYQAVYAFSPSMKDADIFGLPTLQEATQMVDMLGALQEKGGLHLQYYKTKKDDERHLHAALKAFDLCIAILDVIWTGTEHPEDKLYLNENGVSMYESALETSYLLWQRTKDERFLAKALDYLELGKSQLMLEAMSKSRAAYLSQIPQEIFVRGSKIQGRINQLKIEVNDPNIKADVKTQKSAALVDAKFELQNFNDSLKEKYPAYAEITSERSTVSLQYLKTRFSKNNELFVEYQISESYLSVFSIYNGKVMLRRYEMPDDFESRLQAFSADVSNRKLGEGQAGSFEQRGLEIYAALLKPEIESAHGHISRIRVVPDGFLSSFPFEVLPTQPAQGKVTFASMEYAIKKYLISYAPSATLLLDFQRIQRAKYTTECLGMAWSPRSNGESAVGSRGDRNKWSDLPGTAQELSRIEQIIHGKFLYGPESSERTFKELARDYGMLHLALHGSASNDEPILAFPQAGEGEDGILHADELYALTLATRLTVLSACETGIGAVQKGEGVMSMARSFGIAGCPSIVMSLWEVDDHASSIILEQFYRLIARGYDIDYSLRESKLAYLANGKDCPKAPYFWAAYIPVGKTEPVILARKESAWPYALAWGGIAFVFAGIFSFRFRKYYLTRL